MGECLRREPHVWVCGTCGKTGVQTAPGRARKWCSETCRKRQYDLECTVCGGRVDGTTPSRAGTEPICHTCSPAYYGVWTREAIIFALQQWADANGGIPPTVSQWQVAKVTDPETVCSVNHVAFRFGSFNAGIRAAGMVPRDIGDHGQNRVTESDRREAVRLYASGLSSVETAARLNGRLSPPWVIKLARGAGVPIRSSFASK